jgi:histidinol-phosphatase (PHP family)
MKVNYNMHTHTYRCGHASGTDDQYVKAAIKAGFKTLGFSDHAFFPNIVHEHMRGRYEELDGYIESVLKLRKKYKKQIDIKLGFEIEYQENFYGFYRYLLQEKGFDYLILGQHLVYSNDGKPIYYYSHLDDIEGIRHYKDDVIKAMETGLFLYVCHPDIFMHNVTKITPEVLQVCDEICSAAAKLNVPLEINLGGLGFSNLNSEIKGTNPYPNHYFWEIASKHKCKCVIGVDAHCPDDLINNKLEFAYSFIKAHNLELIEDVTMINTNCKD